MAVRLPGSFRLWSLLKKDLVSLVPDIVFSPPMPERSRPVRLVHAPSFL